MQAQAPIQEPVVSAIIPTFRRPQLLRRTIRSVLNQTYPHVRACVFDDASGDETAQVVAELARDDPRVVYFCHPRNIGLTANFAYAMAHVETPYFSFLSDDDLLLPTFYEHALQGLRAEPRAAFFAGTALLMTAQGWVQAAPLTSWSHEGYYAPPDGLFAMLDVSHLSWTGVLFRSAVREQFGLVDKDLYTLDSDLLLRIAAHAGFVVSYEPCAIFMVHPGSTSSNKYLYYLGHDWPIILEKLRGDSTLPDDVRQQAERSMLRALERDVYHVGIQSAARRKFADAHVAARVLREQYQQPRRARTVATVARVCQWVPPVYGALALAYKIQHLRYRSTERSLQDRYGALARYLEVR